MERLKNKEILVGREPEKGRLMIAVDINGQHKAVVLGEFKSVPDGVSRCKPAEGTAHCKIAVDANGSITVTNLKPANCTYINNRGITTKSGVKTDAQLQLGADKYPVALNAIVEAAKKLLPTPEKVYSIKHLEKVWEEYYKEKKKTIKKEKLLNTIRGLLSTIAIVSGFVCGGYLRIILMGLGVVLGIYTLYDIIVEKSDKKKEKLDLDFEEMYICPGCKRFLMGANFQPYRHLRQNHNCPYCKCKWTED